MPGAGGCDVKAGFSPFVAKYGSERR